MADDDASEQPDNDGIRLSSTTRTEAFSDGVLAIAITLLVLDLHADVASRGSLLQALLDQWAGYLAYLTSFLTIGIIWLNHHAFFERLRATDRVLQWGNLGLLLFVSFLPFPTSILAAHLGDGGWNARVAAALYGLTGTLMTLPWVALWRHLVRKPRLFRAPFDTAFARREGSRAWVGVVAYLLCAAIGLAVPYLAAFLYLAIAVFYALTSQGWSSLPGRRRPSTRTEGGAE
ncbi:MAG: TMEM175 family protein [Candidatus Dormibacteraceae bacterium]